MANSMPKNIAVTGSTTYVGGNQTSRDTSITLPAVTPMGADVQAMGTLTVPLWSLIENMEMTITKIGVDKGLSKAIASGKDIEVRFIQPQLDANGNIKNILCKAFCKGFAMDIPEIGIEVGSAPEAPTRYSLTRYQMFIDGEEAWLVDRLADIVRIGGKNYTSEHSQL